MNRVNRTLKAPLSDEAYAGWQEWTAMAGSSLTAMLESIGLALHDGQRPPFGKAAVEEIVTRARELTAQRRRKL